MRKRIINLLRYIKVISADIIRHPLVVKQYLFPMTVPVIIINFNQLFFLKQLIQFLLDRGFKNIVIVDNASSYPPLLEYYKSIKGLVTIEYISANHGHMVFFKCDSIFTKYSKGMFILSDADIVPNKQLPKNFLNIMIAKLFKYYDIINKIGFSLNITTIPDHYSSKDKVLQWEQKFWRKELSKDVFLADIDTTFALYKPSYKPRQNSNFLAGIRLGGCFTAEHGGWYINTNNLTEEQKYYNQTANTSASWKLDENGNYTSSRYNADDND